MPSQRKGSPAMSLPRCRHFQLLCNLSLKSTTPATSSSARVMSLKWRSCSGGAALGDEQRVDHGGDGDLLALFMGFSGEDEGDPSDNEERQVARDGCTPPIAALLLSAAPHVCYCS
ncbi:hypothetical protein ACFX13_035467 [Malus domestica]